MKRKDGRRRLTSLREVYEEKKVTCGVLYGRLKVAWKEETRIKGEIIFTMQ